MKEMKLMDLNDYIAQIDNPSKDFKSFLYNYFTGPGMIRGRGEEDTGVWQKLKGVELEVAKQLVMDHLYTYQSAYVRAVAIFRDERALPILKNLIEELRYDYKRVYERTLIARVLFDWIGYNEYYEILDNSLIVGGQLTKISLFTWIQELSQNRAIKYIFMMLEDKDDFVRWCAYDSMKRYFHLKRQGLGSIEEQKQDYEENKYYTADEVYNNKPLFYQRMNELRNKIESI